MKEIKQALDAIYMVACQAPVNKQVHAQVQEAYDKVVKFLESKKNA